MEPTDDILGALVTARDEDPDAITEGELQSLLMAILVAGYETTANQLGKFVLCLLERPEQLQILREHPELMANAVEELMRFIPLSAGSQLAYLATEDVEIGGVLIRAGEGVMPSTASANRDESVFAHADQVDVERTDIFQLGFGHGVPLLPGRALARVELQVALTSLFARFPDLRLAVPAAEVPWKDGSAVWGLEASLPLFFSEDLCEDWSTRWWWSRAAARGSARRPRSASPRKARRVVVGDLAADNAEAVAAGIRATGGTAVACAFDISVDDSVGALMAAAVDEFGGLDLLHANAADMTEAAIMQ